MGELSEFPLKWRLFLRAYSWRRIDPVPFAAMAKPLREASVAIVSSAGLVLPGQAPFDDSIKGGDPSYREIPADTDTRTLIETHRSELFDHSGIRDDANLAFPLDRLKELKSAGVIGAVAPRHFSTMGSITAPGRMLATTAPAIARLLRDDGVDAALLVPV